VNVGVELVEVWFPTVWYTHVLLSECGSVQFCKCTTTCSSIDRTFSLCALSSTQPPAIFFINSGPIYFDPSRSV